MDRITIKQLKELLEEYNENDYIVVYEGEVRGLRIENKEGRQIGFIDTEEGECY